MSATLSASIPRLENGDELTSEEFERRYEAMPDVKKAELIEGVVYMASPGRTEHHGEPHNTLGMLFGLYRARTPGVAASTGSTVRLDIRNVFQPDLILYVRPTLGGQSSLNEGYLVGGPELVAE